MNQNISIAICVLFFEKADQTIECVESFAPSGVPIYILNNNSSVESTQKLKEYCGALSQVKIFESEKNLGVSGGRNFLVKNTSEEWLFFVDNDITITTPDWLAIIRDDILNHPNIEVFIPRLYNKNEDSYSSRKPFKIVDGKLTNDKNRGNGVINVFSGGASVISRKLFLRNGMYDEEMFVGFEDYEYALRAMSMGAPIKAKVDERVDLIHDHRTASTEEEKSAAKVRYDLELHQASYERFSKKYGVEMTYDWKFWLKNQQKYFLKGKKIQKRPFFTRIILKAKEIIKRMK